MGLKNKNIVILGAGIGGLQVARGLQKGLKGKYSIFLVDKNNTHLFTDDLYEVATAFKKDVSEQCLFDLKETVAIPIKKLINVNKVHFIQDEVTGIDTKKKMVKLKKDGNLAYSYLVVALGAVTNTFNIEGIEEFGMPLKTVKDALRINCHLDQFFQKLWKEEKVKRVSISVGGGGPTGVEVAAELASAVKRLCKKYKFPCNKVKIHLVQGGDDLAGLEKKGTKLVKDRLKKLGVEVHMSTYIERLTKTHLHLKRKKGSRFKEDVDMLFWTAGVKVNPVVAKTLGQKELGGAILVTDRLQAVHQKNIFALGDNAYQPDRAHPQQRNPMIGRIAFEQGKVVAKNIIKKIKGQNMDSYHYGITLYLVPVGGKYGIFQVGPFLFKGFWMWAMKRAIVLRYYFSIMSPWLALLTWYHSNKIFVKND